MRESRWKGYLCLIPAVCTAAALSMDMGLPRYHGYPEAVWNALFSLGQRSFLPLCAAAWFLYRTTFRKAGKRTLWLPLLLWNAFAARVWLMAEGFRIDGTVAVMFSTAGQRVKAALYFAGAAFALQGLSACLYALLDRSAPPDAKGSADGTPTAAEIAKPETEEPGQESYAEQEPEEAEKPQENVTGREPEINQAAGELEQEAVEQPEQAHVEQGTDAASDAAEKRVWPKFRVSDLPRLYRRGLDRIQIAARDGINTARQLKRSADWQGVKDEARRLGYGLRRACRHLHKFLLVAWHTLQKAGKRTAAAAKAAGQRLASAAKIARRKALSAVKSVWRRIRRALGWLCLPFRWTARGARWFGRKCPFLAHFFSLLLLWTPHVLIAYPAAMTPSAWNQLSQYFGMNPWTNFHPPASTLLMGKIVEWGMELGKQRGMEAPGNLGLFLYAVFQAVFFAAVLAYVFRLMALLDTPSWLRRTAFLCCLLAPFYTAYLSTILKDSLYSSCFLLMTAVLCWTALRGRAGLTDWRHVPFWCLSVLGVVLLRHNGKYIAWPLALLLACLCLRSLFRGPRKEWLRSSAAVVWALLPVIIAGWIAGSLAETYEIEPGSVREAFSLPFQQTARYVKYFGGEVTDRERQVIDAVLDYDKLAENYDPRLADPVKDSFREEADGEDLKEYFEVWFRQFLRHPGVYCAATAHQNYYLLYPFVPNESVFTGLDERGRDVIAKPLGIQPVPELKKAQFNLNHWYRVCFWIPGVNLMTHLATYTMLLAWLTLFALRRKLYRWLLPAFPVFLSLGVSVAAPVIQGHPRYAFPVVYSVPLLAALWIDLARRQEAAASGAGKEPDETPGGVSDGNG
ncbi:MAG: hypothetical protein IJT94_07480 [Oscillibacter sp.]|nr:hypothetical protein [Oscillibacter sp.]